MNGLSITNIQRFSLRDGPGIRTVVFMKGCSLHCPWCSNPENISFQQQPYKKDGEVGIYGNCYSPDQLYDIISKDKTFYFGEPGNFCINNPILLDHLPGGVTFSGGEALMQVRQMEYLLKKMNHEHIHIAVETSLFVPQNNLETALEWMDLFYVDMKFLDPHRCKKYLGGNLDLFLKNLEVLFESGKPVVIRIPVIGGWTDDHMNQEQIVNFIKEIDGNLLKVELIKEHNLALSKYKSLVDGGNDVNIPVYQGVSDKQMEAYQKKIKNVLKNIPIEICRM